MRALFLTLLLVAVAAAPLEAQVCREGPPPPLSTLFPDEVEGLAREFYDARDGCVTNVYKQTNYVPAADAPSPMWTVVMIEPHSDPFLGHDPETMKAHYERSDMDVYEVDGWPITGSETGVGFEFVTLKGDLRIGVVVKEASDQATAWKMARRFFEEILPKVLVPCQT